MTTHSLNLLLNYDLKSSNFSSDHKQKILKKMIEIGIIKNTAPDRLRGLKLIELQGSLKIKKGWNEIYPLIEKNELNTIPSNNQYEIIADNIIKSVSYENSLNLPLTKDNTILALKSFFEVYCAKGKNSRDIHSFLKVSKLYLGQGSPGDQFILSTLRRLTLKKRGHH